MIEAFHQRAGRIRPRVIGLKALVSMFALGTGGAGGRRRSHHADWRRVGLARRAVAWGQRARAQDLARGGGSCGHLRGVPDTSWCRAPRGRSSLQGRLRVGRFDPFRPRERRLLLRHHLHLWAEHVVCAGSPFPLPTRSAATLRAPGAAGGRARSRICGGLSAGARSVPVSSRIPLWARPAVGGLLLGVFTVPLIVFLGEHIHQPGQGLGLLGGGYGAVQMAIAGSEWLPEGWTAVALLAALAVAKLLAASLTIGSGGSAGDFAPSLAMGGMFGGAFGRAAQLFSTIRTFNPARSLWLAWARSTEASPTCRSPR